MRVSISLFMLFFSLSLFAHEAEPEIRELFNRYDLVMSGQKTKAKDVFTKKFLEDFDDSQLNEVVETSRYELKIEEGLRDKNFLYVKRVRVTQKKPAIFILVKENNSWRIEGTANDDH